MGLFSLLEGGVEVVYNIAHFFFNIPDNFNFSISSEGITSFVKNFLKVGSYVSSGKMNALNSMWDGVTFIDRNCVRNTVT